MSDNFNIDELFEDSLGGLKQNPKEMSWDNIEQELGSSTPSEAQFDELVAASMAGFSVKPSNSAWSNIDSKLDDIDNLNTEFDSKVEDSYNNNYPQASKSVWSNIEQELDAMDAYRIAERKRFVSWFAAAGSVAAVFIYFILQIQPSINFRNKQSQLVNKFEIRNNINVPKQETIAETVSVEKTTTNNEIIVENIQIDNNQVIINNKNVQASSKVNSDIKKSIVIDENENAENNNDIVQNEIEESIDIVISNKSNSQNNVGFDNAINEAMMQKNIINNDKLLSSYASLSGSAQPLPTSIRSINAVTGFSIDLFGGPEYIHSPSEIVFKEGDNISIVKKSAYITDYSFGANIKFHYNKFFAQSGMVYSNFGDAYSLNQNNEIHDTSGGYYSYNINTHYTYDTLGWDDDPLNPGVLVPILVGNLHTDTIITDWNSMDSLSYQNEFASAETRYRYIEIPLMLSYQLQYKDWSFLASAGASYGFKVADKAVYTSDNTLKNHDKISSPYSNSNINGIVSIGIAYAISNKISVVLQPTYKTNFTGLTAQSTKYHSLSIRCGINVKL